MNTEFLNEGTSLPVADAHLEQQLAEAASSAGSSEILAEAQSPQVIEPAPEAAEVKATAEPVTEATFIRTRPRKAGAPNWPTPRMSPEGWARRRLERQLDKACRHSPRLMRDRDLNRDCLTQMSLYRSRPDVLANALLDMGITESGDGVPDKHFR